MTFGYKRELNPLKFINGGFLLNQQDRWVCVSRNNDRRQEENKDNVTDTLQYPYRYKKAIVPIVVFNERHFQKRTIVRPKQIYCKS